MLESFQAAGTWGQRELNSSPNLAFEIYLRSGGPYWWTRPAWRRTGRKLLSARNGIFELREVNVSGRDEFVVVVDVDGRWTHYLVKVAKPFAVESGRLAGISVGFSLFAKFD